MTVRRKPSNASGAPPLVLIVMGSESDLPKIRKTMDALDEFKVSHAVEVASAHRAPKYLEKVIRKFEKGGGKTVIAAAGGAAHLPGVAASMTSLPVIGLPVAAWATDGLDSLLSIAQMPPGMPVACMAIDGARNAGLFAVQMLALSDADLSRRFDEFRSRQTRAVIEKSSELKKELAARK